MRTAIDSSVLWSLIKEETGWEAWAEALQGAASEGPLLVTAVTFAELSPSAGAPATLTGFLNRLGIRYDDIREEAAFLAGSTFKAYRLRGGPRQHLVPDFLIAAHAQVQADRLAAKDRGYLRRWFPHLRLLEPAAN